MSGAILAPMTTLIVFCLCPIVLKQGLKRAGGPTHYEVRSGWIKNGISKKFCCLISLKKAVIEASKRLSNILNEDRHRTSKKGVHAAQFFFLKKKERKCNVIIAIVLPFDPSRHLSFGHQRKNAF